MGGLTGLEAVFGGFVDVGVALEDLADALAVPDVGLARFFHALFDLGLLLLPLLLEAEAGCFVVDRLAVADADVLFARLGFGGFGLLALALDDVGADLTLALFLRQALQVAAEITRAALRLVDVGLELLLLGDEECLRS